MLEEKWGFPYDIAAYPVLDMLLIPLIDFICCCGINMPSARRYISPVSYFCSNNFWRVAFL